MFGIGFFEFVVIAIIIIIFLGPDKLPEAFMKVVKTLKTVSKTVHEAKSAIEEEINLEELKEDSKKYRALLEKNTQDVKKSFSLEELENIKEDAAEVNSAINELKTKKTDGKQKNPNIHADESKKENPNEAK
ncbi:MAG: Sec-independent protein translocase protein TatB [Campylobacteraceae bacterium]|nr:Sec-independent protein translocase protein TatB [Campylobacteraceae bacterium]